MDCYHSVIIDVELHAGNESISQFFDSTWRPLAMGWGHSDTVKMSVAGLGLPFQLLPSLDEGDERICLGDVLSIRDVALVEEEMWAVCSECCRAIESVNNSPDKFQSLCITPDSLAFDMTGTICFLDIASGEITTVNSLTAGAAYIRVFIF